jgi:hypothetical protein
MLHYALPVYLILIYLSLLQIIGFSDFLALRVQVHLGNTSGCLGTMEGS